MLRRLIHSPVLLIALFLAATLAVPSFAHGPKEWERNFVTAGVQFRDTGVLYTPTSLFVYPPFVVLLTLPSTYLTPLADRVWWWAVNTIAATVLVCVSWVLAGGRFGYRQPRREFVAAGLGAAAALGFVFDVAVTRQIDLGIGALVVVGVWLASHGRPVCGGWVVGVAAAAKCSPLLFAPYFGWTGRWAAAAAVLVAAVAVNLVPDAVVTPLDGRPRLLLWAENFLPVVGNSGNDPGAWNTDPGFNHSLAGVTTRLLTRDHVYEGGQWVHYPRVDRPSAGVLKIGVYAVGLLLVAAGAAAAWIGPRTRAGGVFEAAMIVCLMLLLAPVSSKTHFCMLLLPAFAVARYGVARRDGIALGLAVVAAVAGLLTNRDLVGKYLNSIVMWYGAVPGLTLLLYGGCLWGRLRTARNPHPEVTPAE